MHARVKQLPVPQPDYRRFLQVLRRERPDRVPLIELGVHQEVVTVLLDESSIASSDLRHEQRALTERTVQALYWLGYDVVKVSARIPWDIRRLAGQDDSTLTRGNGWRQWANERHGPIGSLREYEQFAWPTPEEIDWEPVESAVAVLPEGMALLGFSGGILEFSMDLMGMENFMVATLRDPELVAKVVERVGQVVYGVFEKYCQMERVCALWMGDDLGHKHGLLLSLPFLNQQIVPWFKRLARLAHDHDRPFLLHTCGSTEAIMPILVEEVRIDAKHSFQDNIQTVEQFIDLWGDRVAVLGGVDVHLLSVGSPAEIRRRVHEILDYAAPRGGYACGSGNSIPNYISAENYLTMVEAVAEFNSSP